jgi:enoyl-CoA hydratase
MEVLTAVTYDVTGRIARITLNRPERGNAIDFRMPAEIADCVERANLDPAVHVIALAGNGKGFCGGYDLLATTEEGLKNVRRAPGVEAGSPLDPEVQAANHEPSHPWDPMIDYAFMSRNVRAFMSLFHSDKPVVGKVHGFCVAGGTDLALCCDLMLIEDRAQIGYPPARVWGVPTTAMWALRVGVERAKRLLFTGDCISGEEAAAWGLATEAAAAERLGERFEWWLERIGRMPVNQLMMMKLLVHQTLAAPALNGAQVLATVFDGIARHTPEGQAFRTRAAEVGFKRAVAERDAPFAATRGTDDHD